MSNRSSQQLRRGEEETRVAPGVKGGGGGGGGAAGRGGMEELPLESSPYVKYSDLEDYKRRGYGTEGHQGPVDNQPRGGGGGTDAPTLSGSGLSEGQVKVADAVHRKGIP